MRNHAIETPHLKDIGFDAGEIERERKGDQAGREERSVAAQQGKDAEEGVSGDADYGDRDMGDFGEPAMVHDAAVPFLVDAARLHVGGVMNVQGEAGDDHAAYSQKEDK